MTELELGTAPDRYPTRISVANDPNAVPHSIFHVNELLDLNGDGTLEIVIERNDNAGWGQRVFDPAGNPTAVDEHCGT